MTSSSKAYLVESALYGDPPSLPGPLPVNQSIEQTPSSLHTLDTFSDTPANYVPGLFALGSTYDVLNGRYADPRSIRQQVIDWSQSDVRTQIFGDKEYSVPTVVNYVTNTSSEYRSSYGKTTSEYTNSLSTHAGFDASFPGFSSSVSADYRESQRRNLSNSFTRIAFNVTHYHLSLPPISQIPRLLKPWFIDELNNRDPIAFFREYGTHILSSVAIGGQALFLYSTDTRTYTAQMSIEAAAKVSASYCVASGKMSLTAPQKKAMDSLNESSETTVVTRGGDPQFGNEEFLKNVESWTKSIIDFPEFVEFGSTPAFVGLWEFASTPQRRAALQGAYAQFIQLYAADLSLPGPYLRARLTEATNPDQLAEFINTDGNDTWSFHITFPAVLRSGDWYLVSPGNHLTPPVLARELVPGALTPVKWAEAFTNTYQYQTGATRIWKAVPPTSDYIALGVVAMSAASANAIPSQPPDALAGRFRAIHKLALTGSTKGVTDSYQFQGKGGIVYRVDHRYVLAGNERPVQGDTFVLDPKMSTKDWSGW